MGPAFIRRMAALWITAVIGGSFMPVGWKIAVGTTTFQAAQEQVAPPGLEHRLCHFVAFGVAAGLLLLLAATRWQEVRAVTSIMALGLTIEYVQHLALGSVFEWWDLRDDWISVLAVFLAWTLSLRPGSAWRFVGQRSATPTQPWEWN
jgi:hypothetical protein